MSSQGFDAGVRASCRDWPWSLFLLVELGALATRQPCGPHYRAQGILVFFPQLASGTKGACELTKQITGIQVQSDSTRRVLLATVSAYVV